MFNSLIKTAPLNDGTKGNRFVVLGTISGIYRKRSVKNRLGITKGVTTIGLHLGKRSLFWEHKRALRQFYRIAGQLFQLWALRIVWPIDKITTDKQTNGVKPMKNFVLQVAAFLIWCFTLVVVCFAPFVFDTAEAIAAMLCATVAAFGILTVLFWESL